uniref:Coiled-coil domain containing 38 n=1 Tax=Rhinopithecus bieti TaxID=61621 RepID=A0A2K6N2D9_RHIBE
MSSNLSPTLNSGDKVKDGSIKEDRPYKIFFRDLFLFKENEMAAKKREKLMNRNMKVYQKTTFSSRVKSRSYLSQLAFYPKRGGRSFEKFGPGPAPISRLIEGTDTKRTVHEFINDQRDRFLLEYALTTKRNTIKTMRERQLKKAEKKLQDDALAFEEFLRENDQRSVDALKLAAQETINKLQMTAELKKASMEVQAVKSEIAKTEFLLKEYMKYAKLSLHSSKKEAILSEDASQGRDSQGKPSRSLTRTSEKMESNLTESFGSEDSLEFLLDDEMDFDLEPALYFKEPEELLQVLRELEEQNLTLFQYSQDVDENLEEVNKREKVIQDKTNSNIEFLLEQEEMLKANCMREEEKAAELQLRSRLFSFGEFNSDAQEILIDSLSKKITEVYKVCIGDAEDDGLNPIQKLVKVESRLVELCDLIESIPKENVEAIERMKQKERRQKFRDEKMKEKQRHQEERLKAALEKAVAQPKKRFLGRRLVYHSKPPSANKQQLPLVNETKTKAQEEEYFFT